MVVSPFPSTNKWLFRVLLLMAEILYQLIGSVSHYLQGFSTIPGGCLRFLPSTVGTYKIIITITWATTPTHPENTLGMTSLRSLKPSVMIERFVNYISQVGGWINPCKKLVKYLDHHLRRVRGQHKKYLKFHRLDIRFVLTSSIPFRPTSSWDFKSSHLWCFPNRISKLVLLVVHASFIGGHISTFSVEEQHKPACDLFEQQWKHV